MEAGQNVAVRGTLKSGWMQARASVALRQMGQIRLPDVQQLILWVCGEGHSPQWVHLKVHQAPHIGWLCAPPITY